jgi:hypothetical protein
VLPTPRIGGIDKCLLAAAFEHGRDLGRHLLHKEGRLPYGPMVAFTISGVAIVAGKALGRMLGRPPGPAQDHEYADNLPSGLARPGFNAVSGLTIGG